MKICEAIEKTDSLIPNNYDRIRKIEWLSEVDGLIYSRILSYYKGSTDVMPSYDAQRDTEKELQVPAPHDKLYVLWLEAQIAYYNGESDRYHNAHTMFNSAVKAFAEDYNRTHLPKNGGTWKW